MFNMGFTEMLVIAAAALLIFGPKRLPELAKGLGKGIRDFKKALEGGDDEESKGSAQHQAPDQIASAHDSQIATPARKETEPSSKT